jgi:hypothetical protein
MPQFLQVGLAPLWLRILSHRHQREESTTGGDRFQLEYYNLDALALTVA